MNILSLPNKHRSLFISPVCSDIYSNNYNERKKKYIDCKDTAKKQKINTFFLAFRKKTCKKFWKCVTCLLSDVKRKASGRYIARVSGLLLC